jgi:orotate phosphoribosyltransferase
MSDLEHYQQDTADALLDIGAVGFTPHAPVTFKSGIVSPVYVDSRRLPFHPKQWHLVIDGFRMWIREHGMDFDVIAGIEAGGIPHSAALGYAMDKPSLFVRKRAKEHGKRQRVEGGDVDGKNVLLVEDLVTTGGSSLDGVTALREAGAQVTDCLAIVSYEFGEAGRAFDAAAVRLHVLAPFRVIAGRAHARGDFDDETLATLHEWHNNPHGWANR